MPPPEKSGFRKLGNGESQFPATPFFGSDPGLTSPLANAKRANEVKTCPNRRNGGDSHESCSDLSSARSDLNFSRRYTDCMQQSHARSFMAVHISTEATANFASGRLERTMSTNPMNHRGLRSLNGSKPESRRARGPITLPRLIGLSLRRLSHLPDRTLQAGISTTSKHQERFAQALRQS